MSGSPGKGGVLEVGDAGALRRALLAWYRKHHRRLPWRDTRDPYRIWVSEVMLQQTQVATALPYYERFVARFPDVAALARATRGDVLAAWAGLGYYRRARFLHEAAGLVVREHAGRIPSDARAFASLPGVGRYTLGAVLSIGFGQPLPVLDGNVARVFSRLTGTPVSVKRPSDARRLWELAASLMPAPRRGVRGRDLPGQWNQALMELGARVCTPRAPRCGACPIRRQCVAQARGLQDRLPPVVGRRVVERVRRAVACVWHRGRMLVTRREGKLLDGLWEPPGVELAPGADACTALAERLLAVGVRARLHDSGRRVRHTITHRDIRVEVWTGSPTRPAGRRAGVAWVAPGRNTLALSALAGRLLTHKSSPHEVTVVSRGRGVGVDRGGPGPGVSERGRRDDAPQRRPR